MPPSRDERAKDWAESLAIEALGFLAGDVERLEPFLSLTGIDPSSIRRLASEPSFLAAVLDHLACDESLLLAFAANAGHDPADIERARLLLSGPAPDWGP